MVRGLRISEEVIQKIIASDTDITTLAVSADGKLYAWGSGASGLVITDDKGNTTTPDSKGDAEPSFSPDGMQLLLRASAPVIKRYLLSRWMRRDGLRTCRIVPGLTTMRRFFSQQYPFSFYPERRRGLQSTGNGAKS